MMNEWWTQEELDQEYQEYEKEIEKLLEHVEEDSPEWVRAMTFLGR
jgi:hypothetical protein